MDQAVLSATCKSFTTDPDKGPVQQLFVLVHWHEDTRRFDVSLTDCTDAWFSKGCTTRRNESNIDSDQAWQHTKEALGDTSNGQYIYWTTKHQSGSPQQLQLWWAWELGHFQGREVMALQPPLQQQPDGAAAMCNIMRHMMASYSMLKAAVAESKKAQQLLERSLADKENLLKQKVQAEHEQEQLLFTKFAMLLNKKTERIQLLTAQVQEQQQQIEQLRGMEEQDTDDEAKAMAVYAAETEDDEEDEQLPGSMQQQQGLNALVPPAAADPEQGKDGAVVHSKAVEEEEKEAGNGTATPAVDLDGATQLLAEEKLAALAPLQQQSLQQQQQQQARVAAHDAAGAAVAAEPGAGVADAQIGGIDWRAVLQLPQGAAVDSHVAHKSKAIKRRR